MDYLFSEKALDNGMIKLLNKGTDLFTRFDHFLDRFYHPLEQWLNGGSKNDPNAALDRNSDAANRLTDATHRSAIAYGGGPRTQEALPNRGDLRRLALSGGISGLPAI